MINIPDHIDHFRGGNVLSFDRVRRTDASERRTDAEVMAKAMGQAAPDPERDKVLARLKQEGRTPEYTQKFLEGFDEARQRTDLTHAHYSGLREGNETASQAHAAIDAAKEKRTDAQDAAIMARAMRGTGAPVQAATVVRADAREGRVSASERARQANETRMRTAWYPPAPTDTALETRQDDASEQRPTAHHTDGPRLSASERAKRANEERQRNAWRSR